MEKPRTLFWEWLVLGRDSPLRALLAREAARSGFGGVGDAPFGFLPALRFERKKAGGDGRVERALLEPLGRPTRALKAELARAAGRSLAFFAWFGASDLHWENLVLGRARGGELVFAPLDIELVLAELSFPTETQLLPHADPEYRALYQHAAGVRRILPFLGKPVAAAELLSLAAAYREMLLFLDDHARTVAKLLDELPELRRAPIRVCLRSTAEYVTLGEHEHDPPLLAAEVEQLARGDVPYFFRLYGQRGIRYYADASLETLARLPLSGDVPRPAPLLSLGRGLRAPSRRRLAEQGLLLVLGAFDHAALRGRHDHAGLSVSFGARSLEVRFPGGELACPRNLRSFVSSVYLPCRCGEVRSVFVPPVTRCTLHSTQ